MNEYQNFTKLLISLILYLGFCCVVSAQNLNPSSISTNGSVNVIVQDSSTIYLGGSFSAAGYKTTGIAKINSSALSSFEFPSVQGQCYTAIKDGSGGWYIGGNFSVQGISNLIHLLANNTIDVSFAPNPNSTVNALNLDGTTLYVGGSFSQISGQTQRYLAAIDAKSGSLQNWNPNPDGGVNSITKEGNIVYVGGSFQNIGGRESRNLAAVDATTGSANPFISVSSTVNSIEQDSTNLYLGGSFSGANGYYTGANSLLTTTSDLPNFKFPITNGSIAKSIPDGNGGWYVGGNFSVQGISNLIHILSNNTVDVSFAPNPNSTVNALHLDGTTLYVGGSFSQIGSQNQKYLAAIDATSGSLQNWNPNPDGGVSSITKEGNIVYVGGSFQNIGGRESRNLAAVDATTGFANPFISVSSTVNSIEQDATNLYLGGSFSGANGYYTGANSLLTTTSDLPNFTFPIINGSIAKSIPDGNGGWYVGGNFSVQGISNLIHILSNNTVDLSFVPNPNSTVNALHLDGTTLYVGGSFSQISGQTQRYLAAIDATSGSLQNWNPNPDGGVNSITKDGNIVYVGGSFQNIGGRESRNLAAVDATTGSANPFISVSSTVNAIEQDATNLYLGGSFSGANGYYTGANSLLTTTSDLPNFTFPIINGSIAKSIPDGNGGWYVGGNFSVQGISNLIHILSNNTVDLSFVPNPNSTVNALHLDGTTLYVGGSFSQIGSQNQRYLAAIDATSGSLQNWNPNPDGGVSSITKDGNIVYVGGSFTNIGGQNRNYIAALNSSTALATNWNPNANSTVSVLEINGSEIIAAGSFNNIDGQSRNYLAALTLSTGKATTWNPNPNSTVNAIELNGANAYIGGYFSTIGGQPRNYISEISLTTGNATTWNPNADASVSAIKLIGTSVYVGGSFTTIGGQSRNYLAALNNTNGNATTWNPTPNGTITTIGVNGTSIFTGGSYQYLKTASRNYLMAIAKSNGLITTWNPNPNSIVNTIELNGANAYIGGYFSTIGGQPRNYIAEISLTTGNATTWNPNADASVSAIKLIGTTVYVGGSFTTIGGQSRNYLAALNKTNGSATAWNPKPNGTVYKISQANTDVIATGAFTFMNSEQRSNLIAISKSTGLIKSWNPNPNSTVETIEINGLNAYVGGSFTTIGGQPRNNIAEISLSTGNASTWNPNANSTVNAIKRFGTTIYVGGSFTTIGGQNRNYLAALNSTNGTPTSWNPSANSSVRKLAISDSLLYVAGDFTNLSGQNRNRLTSFTLPNGNLTTWNPDVNGSILDLKLTDSRVYIAGYFNEISGQSRSGLASFTKSSGELTKWNPSVNGSVSAILPKGKLVFCGGGFNVIGGQSCNGFGVINANTGIPDLFFPKVNGQINSLLASDSIIYLGGSIASIDNIAYGGLASITYSNAFFKSEVEDYTPKKGGNVGDVTMVINGNGFEDGTKVKLTKSGQSDVLMENLFISDGIQITGTFDLRNKQIGDWNLVVEIPSDTTMIIKNGFAVQQGVAPQPWTSIVGFNQIRVGQWQSYNLIYGNSGNVDAHGVPIWFTVSDNAELDLKFQIQKNYEYFNVPFNAVYDSIPPFIVADTVLDVVGKVKMVGLYIPTIQANSTNSLSFKVKIDASGAIDMMSWTDEPYFGSPLKGYVPECYDKLFDLAVSTFPPANCLNNAFNAGYQAGTYINQAISGDIAAGGGGLVFAMPAVIATGIIDCALSSVAALPKVFKVAKFLNKSLFNRATNAPGLNTAFLPCPIGPTPPHYPSPVQTINSFDPNDKLGPIGEGSYNYINVSNRPLPYIIRCENVDTASAAAQTVVIIDSLDKKVFDLSTFQLGFFSIADSIIRIPSGLKHYETDIDLRPANNIIARVKANLNMQSGVATWEFTSLDPSTLEPTLNPVDGFLPPNVNKPDGEAAVMYSIKALSTIPNGAQIKNKAYIYFDANKPIITNEWVNANDIVKPISSMKPLSEKFCGDSTIVLKWNKSDKGSGVKSCDIYYKVNNGNFEMLQSNLTEDSLIFTGSFNTTYSFFSIAKDSVGNQENIKTKAETKILFLPIQRKTNFQTICKGEVYQINGKKYTLSGTYEDIFKSKNGCDSIVKTILKVIEQSTFKEVKHICQGASYKGYSSTGVYTKKLTNSIGCDSIYTLDLTVHTPVKKAEKKTVCYGSTYKGKTKTGVYYFNYKTSYGCDSIEKLDLEVMTRDTTVLTKTICKGEKYDGYGEAGSYIYKKKNSLGCDSVVSLTLNVRALPKVTLTFREKLCNNTGVFQLDSLNVGNPKGGVFTGDHVQEENLFDPKGLSGSVALTYTYTDEFGCSSSITKNVQLSEANGTSSCKEGAVNEKLNSAFSIYPNPTYDIVTIKVSAEVSLMNYTVTITDVVGKQLQTTKLLQEETDISLRNLGAVGVYMVNVYDAKGKFITCQRVVLAD